MLEDADVELSGFFGFQKTPRKSSPESLLSKKMVGFR